MKYFFLLSFAISVYIPAYSQNTSTPIKMWAFKSGMFTPTTQDVSEWEETNILTVFKFNDIHLTKINIYAKKNTQYDIVGFIKDYRDNSNALWSVYKGVDDNGEEFKIEWAIFSNVTVEHISTLIITNKNGYGFAYKLKKSE